MDLYFQAAAVMLAGAALAYLIYVMMTPAQMFAPMIAQTNERIQARLDNAVNLDIMLFNNAVSVPGTAILPMLQDASTNNLAVFIQTRASGGMVVNYGPQLRGATSAGVQINNRAWTGIGAQPTAFENNFVIAARDLFATGGGMGGVRGGNAGAGPHQMGADARSLECAMAIQNAWQANSANPHGLGLDDNEVPMHDPVLLFWDPFSESLDIATQRGRCYGSTGYLFTAGIRRTNMPHNENRSFAQTPGTPFYINPGSNFHTTFIVDATGVIMGIYVEEHGVPRESAFLAAAMVVNGYINEAIQFN